MGKLKAWLGRCWRDACADADLKREVIIVGGFLVLFFVMLVYAASAEASELDRSDMDIEGALWFIGAGFLGGLFGGILDILGLRPPKPKAPPVPPPPPVPPAPDRSVQETQQLTQQRDQQAQSHRTMLRRRRGAGMSPFSGLGG